MKRLLRLLSQRSVWRAAHQHYRDAARYLDDSDPDWRRCYMRECVKATRFIRALRHFCQSRP
jgi:hypothetical protein